jgi:hypothetical protein
MDYSRIRIQFQCPGEFSCRGGLIPIKIHCRVCQSSVSFDQGLVQFDGLLLRFFFEERFVVADIAGFAEHVIRCRPVMPPFKCFEEGGKIGRA